MIKFSKRIMFFVYFEAKKLFGGKFSFSSILTIIQMVIKIDAF